MTRPAWMDAAARPQSAFVGILCGTGAALFWAIGFVVAKHGIVVGFTPAELALHRFLWSGVVLLPFMLWQREFADLGGIGWKKGLVLTFFGGPPLAIISYSGFLLVPLGHGGLIQPSCAALTGLLLATFVLGEKLPVLRIVGAVTIIAGLVVIGGEALTTIGPHGVLGDLMFMTAGIFFATFGMFLRYWRIPPTRATVAVSVVSLLLVPIHGVLFGFERFAQFGWWENLLQASVQGILAGPGAIYLFARAVVILGAGRGAVFPSLVPPFTLLIGFLALGETPSALQLVGLVIVVAGFRLTQKA